MLADKDDRRLRVFYGVALLSASDQHGQHFDDDNFNVAGPSPFPESKAKSPVKL